MFGTRIKTLLLAALALAAVPGTGLAQQSEPLQQSRQQVQGWVIAMQQIQDRLEEIQAKALEDPELAAAQQALGSSMKTAMEEIDPTLPASLARVEALQREAMAAQQAGDDATLQRLGVEAQAIEQKFEAARQQALQRPELAAQVETFQGRLEARMTEIEPGLQELITRFEQLGAQLAAAMGGGQQR